MNKSKKLLALILTMLLAVSMFGTLSTAMAAEGEATTYTITITPATGDVADHTYEAYQIFSGNVIDEVLCDVTWSTTFNSTAFLAELKTNTAFGEETDNLFANASEATDVVEVLKQFNDNADLLFEFAEVAEKYIATSPAGTSSTKNDAGKYVISGLAGGYYLVKDKDDSLAIDAVGAYTRYILKLVTDAEVTAKAVIPTLDKTIVEGNEEVKANTAKYNDVVNFKLSSEVPDMSGYTKYEYVITDTLSKGLTFNADSVTIMIGDKTLSVDSSEYEVIHATQSDGSTKVTISIANFINYTKGQEIVVEYNATVNDGADLTETGNTNVAYLTYSNDPSDASSFGTTTDIETTTYLTTVKLTKVDGESKEYLTGAKFKVTLEDGTTIVMNDTEVSSTDGTLTIPGLGAGTYKIYEIEAPSGGYNVLTEPITLVISATDVTNTGCTWSATVDGAPVNANNNVFEFDVENNKGTLLPSTGGIGTTIFYIAGGVLVAAAVVYMITKKRMENSEK